FKQYPSVVCLRDEIVVFRHFCNGRNCRQCKLDNLISYFARCANNQVVSFYLPYPPHGQTPDALVLEREPPARSNFGSIANSPGASRRLPQDDQAAAGIGGCILREC